MITVINLEPKDLSTVLGVPNNTKIQIGNKSYLVGEKFLVGKNGNDPEQTIRILLGQECFEYCA